MLPVTKSSARQPRKWTMAEDQKLREEVEAQRSEGEVKDWCRVAAKLPGRTNKDCRKRWLNSVAGGLKKGQWAKSEDMQLAKGVQQFGQRWTLVADVVVSRSADQCAKRWQQSLDPELDRSEWRESEDQILIEAVQKLGRHWKDIQRHHFPGRSKNCIKNRYTVIVRRYQNSGIPLPEGLHTPEPGTPGTRLSGYSTPDEDSMSYSSGIYDDILTSQTQVSTPETHHSWSTVDEGPFTSWASQDSFNLTSTAGGAYPPQHQSNATAPAQWAWTAAPPMEPTAIMATYSPGYPHQQIPYSTYNQVPGLLGPLSMPTPSPSAGNRSSFHGPAPTSSPRPPNAAPHNAHDGSQFMQYGMPGEPPYRY